MSIEESDMAMQQKGWVIFEKVIPDNVLQQLNIDLEKAYVICRELQIKNGIEVGTDGSVHHILNLAESFMDLLDFLPLHLFLMNYFQGNYILNSYGGFINTQNKSAYVGNVHRDIRTFSGDLPLMLNLLVMLDDFTLDNGATYLLSGSHLKPEKPTDEEFYAHAERAIGPAGSLLLFNSNLWHAAGKNQTTLKRRALTLTFTKPFVKQQLDYPRALGYDQVDKLSDKLLQIIGYNARIPEDLNGWYQPPHKRLYKPGQG